ncbi:MAG: hypothetical protein ACFFCS_25855, partial [Candidatus Hodarchaeota archaeon]
GQELDDLLSIPEQTLEALDGADIVIYMMDYNGWRLFKESLFDDVRKIEGLLEKYSLKARLVLFMHKIDKLTIDEAPFVIKEIREELMQLTSASLYFTSLFPHLIYHSYSAFYGLIHSFSEESRKMKKLLSGYLKQYPAATSILLDEKHHIIAQVFGKKVDITRMNNITSCIVGYSSIFSNLFLDDSVKLLTLTTSNDLEIMLKHITMNSKKCALALVSEGDDFNTFVKLLSEISIHLENLGIKGS